jgi:hypothetical protein
MKISYKLKRRTLKRLLKSLMLKPVSYKLIIINYNKKIEF